MRSTTLKESEQDLATALRDLENTRMTASDDPSLSALKDDIRRTIKKGKQKAA